MREPVGRARVARLWSLCIVLAALPGIAWPQSTASDDEFVYRARAGDTLIGIGRRLLIEPRRWSEVQVRNKVADPRRIPLGQEIRIPYAWLRLSPDVASVAALRGEVREGTRTISTGAALAEGSQLRTGADGSVTLVLADGSVITLQKSSVLTLEGMRRVNGEPDAHDTRLKLEAGRVETVVKPQGSSGRFEIHTPVAVSAVRGTRFRGAYAPDADSGVTETVEGLVAVSAAATTVAVPANFGTHVERNAAPSTPVRLLPPPDLQALPATNSTNQLRLTWPAVPGAAKYRVQVAPDAQFRSFVVDTESAAPEVTVAAPADGSYWLRARSIDPAGLEGTDSIKAFTQHRLPAAPALAGPVSGADIVGGGATFSWAGVEPGMHYRIQIARDERFTDVVFDRDAGEALQLEIDRVPPGRYFWRVGGVSAQGEQGDWSASQPYAQREPSPTPVAPTLAGREMLLSWQPQTDARYRVQVARDPQFSALLLDQVVDAASLTARRPRPGTYYVRIQSLSADGYSAPFGEALKFDVPVPRWLKIVLPLLTLLVFV